MILISLILSCLLFRLLHQKIVQQNIHKNYAQQRYRSNSTYVLCYDIPHWVAKYNMTYLFDWTWQRNRGCNRYLRLVNVDSFVSANRDVHIVVNDIKTYLRTHPDEGFIVDDFRQLSNPVPHSMPRSRDFNDTCHALHLMDPQGWESCRQNPAVLSQRIPATTHSVTVAIMNAFVDNGACHEAVPGTVYTETSTFHFQQWCLKQCCNSPIPNNYKNKSTEYHQELLDSVGVYLSHYGHFGPQQLPRIIRLLAVAPKTAKLLVAKGRIADQLIEVMIERG